MPADRIAILLAKEAAEIAYTRVNALRESLAGQDPRETLVSRGEVTRIKELEDALDEGTADLLTLLIDFDARVEAPSGHATGRKSPTKELPADIACEYCKVRKKATRRRVCQRCASEGKAKELPKNHALTPEQREYRREQSRRRYAQKKADASGTGLPETPATKG